MTDVLTAEQRKLNMSRIRDRNTKPEIQVRKLLHAKGFRFRLHQKTLPGKPDLVLSKYRVCIFVHGCFWHGHTCPMFKLPSTRRDFWLKKINGNQRRDLLATDSLLELGWRVLTVWECALRGPGRLEGPTVLKYSASFIRSSEQIGILAGVFA